MYGMNNKYFITFLNTKRFEYLELTFPFGRFRVCSSILMKSFCVLNRLFQAMQHVCYLQHPLKFNVYGHLSIRPIIIYVVHKALLNRLQTLPLARILFFMGCDAS